MWVCGDKFLDIIGYFWVWPLGHFPDWTPIHAINAIMLVFFLSWVCTDGCNWYQTRDTWAAHDLRIKSHHLLCLRESSAKKRRVMFATLPLETKHHAFTRLFMRSWCSYPGNSSNSESTIAYRIISMQDADRSWWNGRVDVEAGQQCWGSRPWSITLSPLRLKILQTCP